MSIYDHFTEKDLEILRERARRIERDTTIEDTSRLREVLLVKVVHETYALPVERVLAVYEEVTMTPLPGTPVFVAGIVNLRGHLVTVLDLAVLLGMEGSQNELATLVVVEGEDFSVGLRVEHVSEVTLLDLETLTPASVLLQSTHLEGVLPDSTALLDLKALLNDPALIVEQNVS
jgi:purine-binding chemotaxis protein CheW